MQPELGPTSYVSLTGGLGNQLFQIAYALNDNSFYPLNLVQDFGRPRTNLGGDAEVFSFELPLVRTELKTKEANLLYRKVIGHTLKVAEHPKKWEKTKAYHNLCVFFSSIVLSLHLKKVVTLITKRRTISLGASRNSNLFYLGYFQGVENWDLDATKATFSTICIKPVRKQLQEDIDYALCHDVTFLHMRLTDYIHEHEIGLLSVKYFEKVLKEVKLDTKEAEVWVFSDDYELAKDLLAFPNNIRARFFSEKDYSVSETFHLMRYGSRYILSNSTFGWWAAFLSKKENVQVIVPEPWFKQLSFDSSLYLTGWKRSKAHWQINENK